MLLPHLFIPITKTQFFTFPTLPFGHFQVFIIPHLLVCYITIMGVCGVRQHIDVSEPVVCQQRSSDEARVALRQRLLELKQVDRVPVLNLSQSSILQRRIAMQETMGESMELGRS